MLVLRHSAQFVILPYELYQYPVCYLEDNNIIFFTLTCRLAYCLFTSWDVLWRSRYRCRFNLQDKKETVWLRGCLGHLRTTNYTASRWFHV
jgi:hypothetical protein